MRSLLDVGVLIALFDAGHIHHRPAATWFADHGQEGWATCPQTQNGCIRILSQPSYLNSTSASRVAGILADAVASPDHAFWPDSISVLTPGALDWQKVLSGRHLTDLYLLALAIGNQGRLVTLDRGIPLYAVPGAEPAHLVVLDHKTH